MVAGGEIALQRVLLNLLSNACEGDGVRRPGEVAVSVLFVATSASILVRVEDDGPGFHPTAAKPGGLGVGLKVVRGISEASGDLYAIKVIEGYRVTLDKQAVVEAMGEKWVEAHSKASKFEQVRVSVLKSGLLNDEEAA